MYLLTDFGITILFVIGGIIGGYVGIKTSEKIPKESLDDAGRLRKT